MRAQRQHQMHLIKSISSSCCPRTAVCKARFPRVPPAPSHHCEITEGGRESPRWVGLKLVCMRITWIGVVWGIILVKTDVFFTLPFPLDLGNYPRKSAPRWSGSPFQDHCLYLRAVFLPGTLKKWIRTSYFVSLCQADSTKSLPI